MTTHENIPAREEKNHPLGGSTPPQETTPWEHDLTSDFEWYTLEGLAVGAMRGRDENGEWEPWTIAYIEDGFPAGGSDSYRYFGSLRDAQRAAIEASEGE